MAMPNEPMMNPYQPTPPPGFAPPPGMPIGGPMPAPPAAPAPSQLPVAVGLAMKRRNPLGAWLGLPLLTLGVYPFVWMYKIHKEMADFDRRRAVPVAGPMLMLLLLSWTFVVPIVVYYNTGSHIRDAQRATGRQPSCSPGLGTFLMFIFGVGVLYYQVELNKIVDGYGASEGTTVPLYV